MITRTLCLFLWIDISGSLPSCQSFLFPVAFAFADFTRLVVIPLSFLRRLDSLKYTSIIALCSIGYLVVLVVYHFSKGDTMADRGDIRVIQWGGLVPVLKSFPVIVFAYTCHQNVSSLSHVEVFTYHSRCSPY